jgi:hypothetical protein
MYGNLFVCSIVSNDTTIMIFVLCGFRPEILEINVVMKTNHA